MTFGEALGRIRRENQMNAKEMAAYLGITASQYHRLEEGLSRPSAGTQQKIQERLNLTMHNAETDVFHIPMIRLGPNISSPQYDKLIFRKRLHESRLKAGLTQRELAEVAFISTVYVTKLEAGKGSASKDVLDRIAVVLGVSSQWLVGNDEGYTAQVSESCEDMREIIEYIKAHSELADEIRERMKQ